MENRWVSHPVFNGNCFEFLMIHDFATAPRIPRELPIRQLSVEPEHKPAPRIRGRLVLGLMLLVVGILAIWRVSTTHQVAPVDHDYAVTVEAKAEYLLAADTEEALLRGPEQEVSVTTAAPSDSENRKIKELEFNALAKQTQSGEDDYGFYDSLQASAWRVPVQRGIYLTEEDRKRASYTYVLQAASLKNRTEAQELVARLLKIGLQASYSVSAGADGEANWYRVNVGPFNNVSVMNKAEDVLVSMHMMPLKRRIH